MLKRIRHFIARNTVRFLQPNLYDMFYGRHFIDFVNSKLNSELTGVEIGVFLGRNAKRILKRMPIKMLYLIDPYETYVQDDYMMAYHDICSMRKATENLHEFLDRISFIRKTSEDAVNDIPDNLDFVYIDGNHQYEFVKKDLELYYPKVRKGGIIGGDDFCMNSSGVPRAVVEFTSKMSIKLEGKNNEWWFVK